MLSTEQKSTQLYKHFLNVSDTRDNRDFYEEAIQSSFCIRPDQLLMYGDMIPRGSNPEDMKAIRDLKDGEYFDFQKDETTVIHIVQYHEDYPLTKIDNGTDNAFKLVDKETGEIMQNIIPFNYCSDLYNYNLKTSAGKKIYFGVGDWVLDTYSGVLKFYGKVPEGVSHDNPPTISFYQYVGGTGFRQDTFGFEGAIVPINNWHISEGKYLIDNVSNVNGEAVTLEQAVKNASNAVQDNFADIFGFDGADDNEGIAYSLSNIVSLMYTSSRDVVKGYDDSSNSDIGVLFSRKSATTEAEELGLKVTYCSPNLKNGRHIVRVIGNTISLSDDKGVEYGDSVTLSGVTKVKNTQGDFIIVESKGIEDGVYDINVSETETSAVLLYWDKNLKDYVPFVTNEDNYYNFGFAVVTANGRIPPSVSIGQITLGKDDKITPDYYGPRNYTITIASEDSLDIKSADYIVRNRTGFYLDDILKRIKADYTNEFGGFDFKGTIFLRAGTYKLGNTLDLSVFRNLILMGEGKHSVTIDGDIKFKSGNKAYIMLKDLNINGDITCVGTGVDFTVDNIIARDFSAYKHTNNINIQNSSLSNVLIDWRINDTSSDDSSADDSSADSSSSDSSSNDTEVVAPPVELTAISVLNVIKGSIIGKLEAKTGYTFYQGNVITDVYFSDVPNDIVKECFINTVHNKPTATQLLASTVINFDNVPFAEIPHMAHFPVYSKNSDKCIEYAKFDNPFEIVYGVDDGQGNLTNLVQIKLDPLTLSIDEQGRLTTALEASQIVIDTSVERSPYYEGLSPTDVNPNKDLQTALNDIYSTKADLNPNGKVPLEQLPDSVAYGGLLLVGTWSFENQDFENGKESEHFYVDGGKYPIYKDRFSSSDDIHTDDDERNTFKYTVDDTQVDGIQPGWFWIVASSKKDEDKPAALQKACLQEGETTPLEFTAGDWVIWNGTKFEKLDRAYQDVAYMVLPVYTTGEHLCWSWRDSEENEDGSRTRWGTGALSLGGETIAESFDMINQELRKLWVKHPAVLSNVVLKPYHDDYKTVTFYRINEDYNVSTVIETSYDKHKDERVTNFRVMTPKTEPKWKSSIYVGDKCQFNATVDGIETKVDYVPSNLPTSINNGQINISEAIDPFDDEIAGSNYWKAVYVDFTGENDFETGTHKFMLGMDDITPRNRYTNDAIGLTPVFGIDVVDPYDLKSDDIYADFSKDMTLNSKSIEDAEFRGVCSGIPTVTEDVTVMLGFTIERAIGDYINADRMIIKFCDKTNNETVVIPESCITLVKDMSGTKESLWNIRVRDFKYTFKASKVSEKQEFSVYVYDVYNNYIELEYPESLSMNVYPALNEHERVQSGQGFVPLFRNVDEKYCGYPFNSSVKLIQPEDSALKHFNNELMKLGRTNSDGENVAEYRWPAGVHHYIKDSGFVDYSSVTSGDNVVIESDTENRSGTYRWTTFNKFWNEDTQSYEELTLSDATGFRVQINVDKDEIGKWDFDEYSMITKNVLIQAKVVDFTQDNDDTRNITKWMDINYPYDGFAEVGTKDNQPAMYAGTSDALSKRVTFGRNTYSGTLLVRIGLKVGSELSFKNISVKDII